MSADRRVRWTDDAVTAEALKYQTRATFKRGSDKAHRAAKSRGLLGSALLDLLEGSGRFADWRSPEYTAKEAT